jgi:hypothetical protein
VKGMPYAWSKSYNDRIEMEVSTELNHRDWCFFTKCSNVGDTRTCPHALSSSLILDCSNIASGVWLRSIRKMVFTSIPSALRYADQAVTVETTLSIKILLDDGALRH